MKAVTIDFHGRPLSVEMGRVARQANGAAYIKYGDTTLLVTAVAASSERENIDFLPLTVDYIEKFSAAGRIPGGFFKREGRPTEREVLTCRLCDRPLRPLFAEGYTRETQIVAMVLSYDQENDPDTLAILGASAALHVSDIPFLGPIAAVRVGRIEGKLVCNPRVEDQSRSDIDLSVAASRDAIVMVEGGANEVPESEVLDAIMFGFESVQPLLALQDELRAALGKPKFSVPDRKDERETMERKVFETVRGDLDQVFSLKEKMPRYKALSALKDQLKQKLVAEDPLNEKRLSSVSEAFHAVQKKETRRRLIERGVRLDDRKTDEIRHIAGEVGILPRTHGSALFTRGETQALVSTTLGTSDDEQRIDSLDGDSRRSFMLHYNFPPFSVGEVKFMRGPGRREIGHGVLAHRAITKVLPDPTAFPYTIRVVSDILESHGSSSMATVCGATLSLMDAGVPIKAPVAGIAMGMVKEGEKCFVLSDISGDEDHIGDMDFKVAGTASGVTAIQMDIKVRGVSREVFEQALRQAREGLSHILERMNQVLDAPRSALSKYAPQIETIQIKVSKIREVIGPGGKVIRNIVEVSGAKVNVEDSGIVTIASPDAKALAKAREMIEAIVAEPEVGRIYDGTVQRVVEYGAFVEIMPGQDGLLHVSEIHSNERIEDCSAVLREGDAIQVKVVSVDQSGKIRLSHREVIEPGSGRPHPREGDGGRRSPGGRDRDRGRGRGRDSGPQRGPGPRRQAER